MSIIGTRPPLLSETSLYELHHRASDYVPMYDMYREGKLDFDNLFNGMIRDRAVPNVDGVYFPDYSKLRDFEKLQIFNNGTVELKIDFEIREQNSKSQQLKTERYLIIFDFVEELKNLILRINI